MENMKQSLMSLAQRAQASPYRAVALWGCYFLIFLAIYGAMLVRGGYHWDETLDFAGGALDTYVANGRWGVVLWRCVFGLGCAVWTSGLLAGLLLTLSLVLQTRLFRIERVGLQVLYGALYLLQVQFAYQMDYFFLCDATAFGLLSVTIAAMLIEQGGWRRMAIACAAVILAVAIYQCLVLNFLVLMLFLILRNLLSGEQMDLWRRVRAVFIVCVVSVLGWYVVKTVVLALVPVDSDALAYCQYYAERLNYRDQLFSSEWYLYVWRMLCAMAEHALLPFTYDGEPFYASALVPLVVLVLFVVRKVSGTGARVLGCLLLFCLWLSPFSMYMVIGDTWPCHPHTKLAQPLVLATLWAIAIPLVKWPTMWRYVGALALGISLVQASALVSRHAAEMQARFEERLLRLHHTETDGVQVAIENGIPLRKGCILYYPASHNWEKNGYVDFSGDYPALLYMDGATSVELYRSRHREHLLQMPVWPQQGSIKVVDDIVIIKGPEI